MAKEVNFPRYPNDKYHLQRKDNATQSGEEEKAPPYVGVVG